MPYVTNFIGSDLNCDVQIVNLRFEPTPSPAGDPIDFEWLLEVNGKTANGIAGIQVSPGDGQPSSAASNEGGGEWSAQFTYPVAGTYTVTFEITDANGDTWSVNSEITITP